MHLAKPQCHGRVNAVEHRSLSGSKQAREVVRLKSDVDGYWDVCAKKMTTNLSKVFPAESIPLQIYPTISLVDDDSCAKETGSTSCQMLSRCSIAS